MNKYDNSVIYMIKSKDKNITDCYIGSTINFKHRKSQHKSNCNNPNSETYNSKIYKFIREHGGFNKWEFEIIVEQKCKDKKELEKMERKYMEENNSTLNSHIPTRSFKQYCEENREALNQYGKQYYKDNKEEIDKKQKQYCKDHKEKINCECGSTVRKSDIVRHKKTIKHINYIKNLSIVL
jgi:predicted GIY-YIG superfamily endonuclease